MIENIFTHIISHVVTKRSEIFLKKYDKKQEKINELEFSYRVKCGKSNMVSGIFFLIFSLPWLTMAIFSDYIELDADTAIAMIIMGMFFGLFGIFLLLYPKLYWFEYDGNGFTVKYFFRKKYYSYSEISGVYFHFQGLIIVLNDGKKYCITEEMCGSERMTEYVLSVIDEDKIHSDYYDYKNREDKHVS
ncbi:hypothetical protein [Porcipelethomonas sp.]|uniref:hypothetical protein n=1 Tax=Porcipelethomonas sp. TaxID=2981675 RepID=UPI003EF40675